MAAQSGLKHRIRELLPAPAFRAAKTAVVGGRLVRSFGYDWRRYLRYSSSISAEQSRQNLKAMLTERYHSIEKGMSLPDPRPGFGLKPVGDVVRLLRLYVSAYGTDEFAGVVAKVLAEYVDFNRTAGLADSEIPHLASISDLVTEIGSAHSRAGTKQVTAAEVLRATESVGLEFFTLRNTVRQFDTAPIGHDELEFAARAARQAPAVCNRQFGRLHVFTDRADIARVLEIQGGARGFAEEIRGLAVVTTNLRSYWDDTQRNQAWVDGGLFAMSFIFGLHAQGIGSVSLNWSKSPATDQRMRAAAGIPEDEAIIMLVGFGKLRSEYRVACSPRVPLDEVLRIRTLGPGA
ncbi:MAG: nitroreductase family protein [Nocardiaceae bacterium]|nr:nitroreductase family protein [Nocardiaceae bacterium]